MRRPLSLAEVAEWSHSKREFHFHIADFLDELRRYPEAKRMELEPVLMCNMFEGGNIADAYIAAVAVEMSREIGVISPEWARYARRRLTRPWFAHAGAALRATLLAESPAGFRERNLFVSANALSRA